MWGFLILDASRIIKSIYRGGVDSQSFYCPIIPDAGGSTIAVDAAGMDTIAALMKAGEEVTVDENGIVDISGLVIGTITNGTLVLA